MIQLNLRTLFFHTFLVVKYTDIYGHLPSFYDTSLPYTRQSAQMIENLNEHIVISIDFLILSESVIGQVPGKQTEILRFLCRCLIRGALRHCTCGG